MELTVTTCIQVKGLNEEVESRKALLYPITNSDGEALRLDA
jgi:hypothetical protein